VDDGRTVPRIRPGAQPREGGEARPKVELVVGDLNDPASLKPAFASVDEAFVVVNGKNLNRLEANALDRSRAFKRLSAKAFHFIGPRPASIPSRWNRSAAALTNRYLILAASVLDRFILRPPTGGTPGRTATSLLTRQIIICFRCQLYSKFEHVLRG
jgi:uncharacterized protein YbjT (DUF2867 family)